MIVDETMTGMGRTGAFLAIEHWEVTPDIVIMGKALGAYCPLAATIFSERVARSFDTNIFGHGQSYSGHALACAAALAGIEVLLDDGLLEQGRERGIELGNRLPRAGRPLLLRRGCARARTFLDDGTDSRRQPAKGHSEGH